MINALCGVRDMRNRTVQGHGLHMAKIELPGAARAREERQRPRVEERGAR